MVRRTSAVHAWTRSSRSASATAGATSAWPVMRPSASCCGRRARRRSRRRRISPHYFVQDGVIPRTRLSEALRRIDELADEYGMKVANVFHAGDGNLHPLVCYAGPEEAAQAEELSARILETCVELGGSLTGEHGIGVDKKAHMPKMFVEPDLAAFQKLRCAFDPEGLANPGKVM